MPLHERLQPSPVRIVSVAPSLDCGEHAIRRVLGESVEVIAEVVAPNPLVVGADVRYRPLGTHGWRRSPLHHDGLGTDTYRGSFVVDALGEWEYAVEAWVDRAETWREELRRRRRADQEDFGVELKEGAQHFAVSFRDVDEAIESKFQSTSHLVRSREYLVAVDPYRARVGAWYELFPRSFGGLAGVADLLPRLSELGFDVLYLTPVHPIGTTNRKGRNNALVAGPGDPGSPWAIGNATGGHTAIAEELGSLEQFVSLVERARELDIEIALDLALQTSLDHPWLKEHPEWFAWREDGSIKYAENPPKRYEDIVNFNFDSPNWKELWEAVFDVVRFWVDQGVRVFRVDNPHTKPIGLWEWLIAKIRRSSPEVIFLAEAFTRPATMKLLARSGFSQSYTYFTWRNSKHELIDYVTELNGAMREYFRANFFVNTPDILTGYLQHGGPAAFAARIVLAATLSPSYGMYSGYEYFENQAVFLGSEEYLDSEKYQHKDRDLQGPLLPLVARLNAIRRSTTAFARMDNVSFLETANDQLIGYSKLGEEGDVFLVCVNLDPHRSHEGLFHVPEHLSLPNSFDVHDVLNDVVYGWRVGPNYLQLEPGAAHVLKVA